ncbi:MAG: vitamin B12-dependent ribonucleotide reductase [Candidatus Micrarchaeia archaeon]
MKQTFIASMRKRDGRIVPFDQTKITNAIYKALESVGKADAALAEKLSDQVVENLEEFFGKEKTPSVEETQDIVEKVLMESGQIDAAKSYILYRHEHRKIREMKNTFDVVDDLKLSINALKVLEARYLKKDANRQVIETPRQMFERVARNIAEADKIFDPNADLEATTKQFYEAMTSLEFLPNSPTLMNAGREIQQLSACFVLPVEDDMAGIFDAVKYAALVHQSGGGTGFSFSRLRPKGDVVKSTMGVASGPISFMRVFNTATEVIKQGGTRRGANMGILRVDHPDILEFIVAKEKEGEINNFNISVAITDKFMEAVEKNEEYNLVNPHTKKVVNKLNARKVFNLIVTMAWKNGEPGVIFIDRINQFNPTPKLGEIEATNPCGEQPLLPYEACNLGSLNLSKMVKEENGKTVVDWEKIKRMTRLAVHFLDNVIEMSKFPLPQISQMVRGNRKIGLGVMGWADLLIQLRIPYNSREAVELAEKLMKTIQEEARLASQDLAEKRGAFPNFKGSIYDKPGARPMRNATVTTIAPTGTLSIIAGCSSGIEPLFAISFIRNVLDGTEMVEINPHFEKIAKERGFYNEELIKNIVKQGSIQSITEIPEDIRRVFVTAHDIRPEDHVLMQAAFQKYTDNAVSKTVNFPHDATVEDVEKVYLLAYKTGCKGITIYRDRSRQEQVLNIEKVRRKEQNEDNMEPATAPSKKMVFAAEYAGGCASCNA